VSTQIEPDPEQETPTLYLIDGSAYIYRAYHAVRGFPTAAACAPMPLSGLRAC
jgi:5'-3' exonuclease